jgi:predicted MPP superfamily phosphohydrolase
VWFVFVLAGLLLVTIAGLYARRRLAFALGHFGVRPRRIRIVRWLMVWLLFGYPLLIIVMVVIALAAGATTLPRFDGQLGAWLLGVPFLWAVLVVMQSAPWLIAIDLVWLAIRKKHEVTRHRALAILAVMGVFAIYTPLRVIIERGDLRVRHHDVGAASGTPLRIAFVADVQQDVHFDADQARAVYEQINAERPDLVLSGGDWINTGPEYIEESAVTAAVLKSRLGTFSVRGDHEHFAYTDRHRSVAEVERAMARHGIAMLNNEIRWFDHQGKRIAVALLNYNYIFRTDRESVDKLLAGLAGADYTIVVTHQLDRVLSAQLADKVDLVLGAHTHGGQINPVVGFLHVPLARLETEYVDGRYQLGKTTIIVTAGVGYSIIPVRYASPGSFEILDLRL